MAEIVIDRVTYNTDALKHVCVACYASTPAPPAKIRTMVVDHCCRCGRMWQGYTVRSEAWK